VAAVARLERLDQLRQPTSSVRAPVVAHGRACGRDDLLVASHQLQIEQSDRRRQVPGSDGPALVDRPDAVVELCAAVPDGVPDAVGQRRDLLCRKGSAIVQQHQVEVAQRTGVAAGHTADTGQGNTTRASSTGCRVPDIHDPRATQLGHGQASLRTGTRGCEAPGVGQVKALLVEVHLLAHFVRSAGVNHEIPPL